MSLRKDINVPEVNTEFGSIHPINQVIEYILSNLVELGFDISNGPEVESDKYNFDLLNIKETHPARQMHDTFYLENQNFLLRTHTSPVQIRCMLENKPPFAFVSGGKVYRKDDDSTHLPMFHQIEGIYIDKDVNFGHMKNLIYKIINFLYPEDTEIRFRPSYFPFTEPSAEVDIKSEDGDWLEILGCGLINPIVLENCNIDSTKYSGLAFGLGVERIAMLKLGIKDIRNFYKSNLDFLKQF